MSPSPHTQHLTISPGQPHGVTFKPVMPNSALIFMPNNSQSDILAMPDSELAVVSQEYFPLPALITRAGPETRKKSDIWCTPRGKKQELANRLGVSRSLVSLWITVSVN
jgi:hypothetical protein